MMTKFAPQSDLAIPPGEFLEEMLDELGMTKDDLARRMGRPASKLTPIFKGEKAITPETALQLEQVLGVPAHIWTGLESEYRLTLTRRANDAQLEAEEHCVTTFCYSMLAKLGEVPRHTRPADKVQALREYFGVMSLSSVLELRRYKAAFRSGTAGERSPEAVAAWLRLGERRAHGKSCAPFSEPRLRGALQKLRAMTLLAPEDFLPKLEEELAACGVVLVVCPHFPKTKAHGATFWLGSGKAVLMLTIRGKWADVFWFSLFHELGHILRHGRNAVILEDNEGNKRETEANAFASDALIPEEAYSQFVQQGRFGEKTITAFARHIGIHKGIVVGRLQHDRLLEQNWLNGLRARYEWAEKQPRDA
jgi:HTH-type transcriptional regulator/antitoxin HigA